MLQIVWGTESSTNTQFMFKTIELEILLNWYWKCIYCSMSSYFNYCQVQWEIIFGCKNSQPAIRRLELNWSFVFIFVCVAIPRPPGIGTSNINKSTDRILIIIGWSVQSPFLLSYASHCRSYSICKNARRKKQTNNKILVYE